MSRTQIAPEHMRLPVPYVNTCDALTPSSRVEFSRLIYTSESTDNAIFLHPHSVSVNRWRYPVEILKSKQVTLYSFIRSLVRSSTHSLFRAYRLAAVSRTKLHCRLRLSSQRAPRRARAFIDNDEIDFCRVKV